MKTRVIQDDPDRSDGEGPGRARNAPPGSGEEPGGPHGPLERHAPQDGDLGLARVRRSSRCCIGNAVGQKQIHGADQFSGESGSAEQALDGAGLRPNDEDVRSSRAEKLTVKDPEFRAAIVQDVTRALSAHRGRRERASRRSSGGAPVSADGHAALVDFEIAGDDAEAADRVDPALAAVAAVAGRPSRPHGRAVRRAPAPTRRSTRRSTTTSRRRGALAAGHADHPRSIAFGSLVAAGVPLLIGITSVIAALGAGRASRASSCPSTATSPAVILLIGLAVGVDYSLFYLRREREERAAGRSRARRARGRRRDLRPRRADLRR